MQPAELESAVASEKAHELETLLPDPRARLIARVLDEVAIASRMLRADHGE